MQHPMFKNSLIKTARCQEITEFIQVTSFIQKLTVKTDQYNIIQWSCIQNELQNKTILYWF